MCDGGEKLWWIIYRTLRDVSTWKFQGMRYVGVNVRVRGGQSTLKAAKFSFKKFEVLLELVQWVFTITLSQTIKAICKYVNVVM